MKTWELKFYELCEEVDYWKEEAGDWQEKYTELRKEYSLHMDEQIKHGKDMMGNFMKLALQTDERQLLAAFGDKEITP